MISRLLLLIVGLLFSQYLQADTLVLQGEITQGSLLRGKLPAGSKVWLNNEPLTTLSDGHFVVGFGRDASLSHTLRWTLPNGQQIEKPLTLVKRDYPTQRIDGVPQAMVTPPKELMDRIKNDNWMVAKARKVSSERRDFIQSFIWPAEGPITGVYGSQRVFNGVPKRPHYGVDVGAPTGTVVVAPAGGEVTLAHGDLYYSGGTIIIDHGLGVNSTFLHLSKLTVNVGDKVKQGQKIGEIGATGRATGPHLDWRINWYQERLDPAFLVPKR